MAEYIERKRVVDALTNVAAKEATGIRRRTLIRMLDAVEQLPSSPPVVPVRHGEWKPQGIKWKCSCCGVLMSIDGTPEGNLLKFCPNCGADMRGADNGE